MTETPKLECIQLNKSYPTPSGQNRGILQNINLQVMPGQIVCLLGVSGVGKTTLFNILAGLETADSGRVLLDGNDITGKKGLITYMQQKDLLLPYLTVLDNICLPLTLHGVKKATAHKKALPLLAEFGLQGSEQQYPAELSGGMRQRAALLRSYLFGQKLWLLDEPFSALDSITRSGLQDWLGNLVREHGLTTLFITHDLDEAILLADKIYIIGGEPGQITAELAIKSSLPRDDDFSLSDEFIAYKRQIKALL